MGIVTTSSKWRRGKPSEEAHVGGRRPAAPRLEGRCAPLAPFKVPVIKTVFSTHACIVWSSVRILRHNTNRTSLVPLAWVASEQKHTPQPFWPTGLNRSIVRSSSCMVCETATAVVKTLHHWSRTSFVVCWGRTTSRRPKRKMKLRN